MTRLDSIRDLFGHMAWADATVWRAVLASAAAQADEGIRDKLLHLHRVQYAFLMVWRHMPVESAAGRGLSPLQLARWAREYHDQVGAYLPSLSDTSLDQAMVLPWASMVAERLQRDVAATTLGETLLQVSQHSTYHRGQVNARLRALGLEPPLTDFIAWVWFGRPPADWP